MMKKAAVRAVSILAYWLGLDALFYFLNRRAKRIVTFHNVIPDDLWVPFPNLVSNKASEFDEIRSEIAPPDGFKGVVFSYPYGERLSVDERCVRIARESGYPCAVSNESGRSSLAGRFFLPRMSLHPDRYRLHFRLSGLEHFLKTGRLTPEVVGRVKARTPFHLVAFEDVKNMLEGKISVLEWLRAVATSDAHFIFSVRDVMPFLFATYIHARQGVKHALRAVLSAIK